MQILVIEDEPGISRFLKQGLEEESFVVDVAETGPAGLAQALAQPYSLLLVDWMLPGLTGLEVCRQLRARQNLTPLIFLAAKDTVQDTIAGLQAGGNDYIKKPFHFEELLERIRVQLRPAALGWACPSWPKPAPCSVLKWPCRASWGAAPRSRGCFRPKIKYCGVLRRPAAAARCAAHRAR